MSRTRRWTLAGIALAVVVVAFAVWFALRTRPDAVGPRFTEALIGRHPGTTVDGWTGGVLRVALPSGVYIDVRLSDVFAACRAQRFACGDAIDRALDDVDRIDRATRAPQRAMLGAALVAEASPGFRFGFVAEPLIGPVELRYVLASGTASTFVTAAIADRLGLKGPALKDAALTALRAEHGVDLQRLAGSAGAATIYRVHSPGDAPASLLDPARMRGFAATIRSRRLYATIPSRGSLYLSAAGAAEARALAALQSGTPGSARRVGLLAYDVDAADGSALTMPTLP